MQHRAWLVDFDGTLYHHAPVKYAMALELLLGGWTAIPTLRRFRRCHEELRGLGKTLPPSTQLLSPFEHQLTLTATALAQPVEHVAQTVETWMMERPRKWIRCFRRRELLREIATYQQQGGLVALVSDYPLRTKLRALDGVSQVPRFDVIVASGERDGPTSLKPAPDGYLAAAQALNIPPQACLVIGDRADADGAAAKAAGMDFRHIH